MNSAFHELGARPGHRDGRGIAAALTLGNRGRKDRAGILQPGLEPDATALTRFLIRLKAARPHPCGKPRWPRTTFHERRYGWIKYRTLLVPTSRARARFRPAYWTGAQTLLP